MKNPFPGMNPRLASDPPLDADNAPWVRECLLAAGLLTTAES